MRMKLRPFATMALLIPCGLTSLCFPQQTNAPSRTEPRPAPWAPVAGSETFILGKADFTHSVPGQPVDCPPVGKKCKDLFISTKPLSSPPGTLITAVEVISRRPTNNNHWFRCQAETICGKPEFSDVADHRKSCIGTSACAVWRAGDDRAGGEDTIRISWLETPK